MLMKCFQKQIRQQLQSDIKAVKKSKSALKYYLSNCVPHYIYYCINRIKIAMITCWQGLWLFWLIEAEWRDAYLRQLTKSPLAQLMTCLQFAPSHYFNQCWFIVNWTPRKNSVNFYLIFKHFHSRKCNSKCRLQDSRHFASASMC